MNLPNLKKESSSHIEKKILHTEILKRSRFLREDEDGEVHKKSNVENR
jgi:hypothetical protein